MTSNPFRYGQIATGEHFTDRAHELDTLVGDVTGGQSVTIISPCRYGKTSLAVQARERLVRERVLVAYADLFALGDTLVRIYVEADARGCTTEAAARRLADEHRARMTA